MLADAKGLLESMFNFDKDNIPEKTIQKIQPYIDNPDFEPKKIESVSKVAAPLCVTFSRGHILRVEMGKFEKSDIC